MWNFIDDLIAALARLVHGPDGHKPHYPPADGEREFIGTFGKLDR